MPLQRLNRLIERAEQRRATAEIKALAAGLTPGTGLRIVAKAPFGITVETAAGREPVPPAVAAAPAGSAYSGSL